MHVREEGVIQPLREKLIYQLVQLNLRKELMRVIVKFSQLSVKLCHHLVGSASVFQTEGEKDTSKTCSLVPQLRVFNSHSLPSRPRVGLFELLFYMHVHGIWHLDFFFIF